MKLFISHASFDGMREEYKKRLVPITSSATSDLSNTDIASKNIFVEILYETLGTKEYYAFFDGEQLETGCIDISRFELVAKNRCLVQYCFIPTKTLFTPERLEEIIRMKNLPYPNIICSVFIHQQLEVNYVKIHYHLTWNQETNRVEAHIELLVSSKEYLEKKMEKHNVSEELISRLLYKKNRYKNVKPILAQ